MRHFKHLFALFFICVFLPYLSAQSSPEVSPSPSAFFNDIIDNIAYTGGQVISLAEAMPQDKYTWRPMEGVRSVSEVYMHIAGANYFLLSFVGGKMPEGMTEDGEKTITNKEEIIGILKDSYKYTKDFLSNMSESDLDKEVEFFGNKMNFRKMVFILMNHSHEHLGQSIAYARTNGVTPPWSMAEN